MQHPPARPAPGLRFGLFGVPVHVDPSFFLITGLLAASRLGSPVGWQGFASWFVAVFVSLLVHELGHAVAFRRFELRPSITLYSMGGLTSARGRLTWGRSLVAALAGPLTGIAFGGLIWFVVQQGWWPATSLFERVLYEDLLFVNILWGIVNLLPVHPLDGGQSLEAILHLLKVKGVARKVAIVSLVVCAGGVLYGISVNRIFLVLIAGYFGYANWQRLQALGGRGPGAGGVDPGPAA